ncbi:MAG: hypothetical protein ACR2QK_10510 [Acidimicrobiales bacterium]
MGADGKRVELIDEGESSNSTSYIGLGLIASLIVGFPPLLDAIQGNGTFENAMLRFLACLAVCVVAASVLGRMMDNAPPEEVAPSPADEDDGSGGTSPLIFDDAADGAE